MATAKKAATGTTKKAAPKAAGKQPEKQEKKTAPVAKAKTTTAKAKVTAPKVVTPAPKKAVVATKKIAETKKAAVAPKPLSAKKTTKPTKVVETKESKKIESKVPNKGKSEMAKEVKVKVPKTTVKTSVPYQPSYQSLEDRVEETMAVGDGPLVRYSDTDLNEFRDIINKKLGDAKRELAYLQGLITRKDHLGGEADSRYMTMEDGTVSMEREQLSQMASRQISYIDHLEKALIRIENKTYGICRVTGKLIDKARLKAVPHATLSLEAKMGMKK
ncbi:MULTISPECIES: TraR/DksA family transcriptional regulator [Chitinophagaceae]